MASIKIVFNDDTKWGTIEELVESIQFLLDSVEATAIIIVDDDRHNVFCNCTEKLSSVKFLQRKRLSQNHTETNNFLEL